MGLGQDIKVRSHHMILMRYTCICYFKVRAGRNSVCMCESTYVCVIEQSFFMSCLSTCGFGPIVGWDIFFFNFYFFFSNPSKPFFSFPFTLNRIY